MRQRASLLLLLGSALAFLASLYLPWRSVSGPLAGPNDGWSADAGALSALFALALAASAAAALVRPALASRAPFGRFALGIGYFGVAAYLELRETVPLRRTGPAASHPAYGAYVALGCVIAVLLVASAIRGRGLLRLPSTIEAMTAVVGAGVLVSFLLPWLETVLQLGSFVHIGMELSSAALAAVVLCLGASLWRREAASAHRFALAVGVVVLVAGAFSSGGGFPVQRYGTWVGLGCALALVAVAAFTARGWRPALPPWRRAATVAASVLLLASLFLPWETFGRLSVDGWGGSGSFAGALALAVVAVVALRRFEAFLPELVAAIAVFVATQGFQMASFDQIRFAYGAYVGFTAAALLVLSVFDAGARARDGAVLRPGAVAACLGYLMIAVVPWWQVLPERLQVEAPDRTSWLTVAGVLIALHLLASWLRRPGSGGRLVLMPLGMLVLVALDLVRQRDLGIGWGGVVVVFLCLFLAVLGWIERSGRPRAIRVPEVLRVDRLPES